MSYRVLALKYRPQTFQDVIGQPHVTQTLSNAILSRRVAHAILFSGPRGTGKTSIARILAKAMNCKEGPIPVPCNVCRSCISITSGNAADVFEIDGASNNSVDQIRELRENVTYMPVSSPHKIYIIDEVHMLSTAAFNALLKTLEEPPDHVLFIFATTEPHKIPITILSRCQRHNLGRIGLTEIANHLEWLASQEGFTISKESCSLIASEADGSMRDSLSLLDRVISSSTEAHIPHDHLLNNLGIIDKKILFDMASAVFKGDGSAILHNISRVRDLGFDLKKVYSGLVELFRNLLVVKLCTDNNSLSDISAHDREQLTAMVVPGSPVYLSQMLTLLLKEESLIRFSSHTRTALETILLQLIQIRPGTDMDNILTRLDLLARNVEPLQASAQSPRLSLNKQTASQASHEKPCCNERPESYPSGATHENTMAKPQRGNRPGPDMPPPMPTWDAGEQINPTTYDPGIASSQKRPTVPAQALPSSGEKTWEGFLGMISSTSPSLGAILSKAECNGIKNHQICVTLCSNNKFELNRLQSKTKEIEGLCKNYFGETHRLVVNQPIETQSTPAFEASEGTGTSPAKLKQEAMNHPLVTEAVNLFSGQIIDIQLK
ncbi:DNA polymerase III subunit gamma/tau [Desulfocicer niacini]